MQREIEIHWLIYSLNACITGSGLSQSQEPGTQSGSPVAQSWHRQEGGIGNGAKT